MTRRQTVGVDRQPSAEQRADWRSGRPRKFPPPSPTDINGGKLDYDNEETEFTRTLSCPPLLKARQSRKNAMTKEQIQDLRSKTGTGEKQQQKQQQQQQQPRQRRRRMSQKQKEDLIPEQDEEVTLANAAPSAVQQKVVSQCQQN